MGFHIQRMDGGDAILKLTKFFPLPLRRFPSRHNNVSRSSSLEEEVHSIPSEIGKREKCLDLSFSGSLLVLEAAQ